MPTDPIVERLNLVEEENKYLKEKLRRIEGDKIKMEEMRLKIRKIKKYAIHTEAWHHYAVGSIVTLVVIMIAFVVPFNVWFN